MTKIDPGRNRKTERFKTIQKRYLAQFWHVKRLEAVPPDVTTTTKILDKLTFLKISGDLELKTLGLLNW